MQFNYCTWPIVFLIIWLFPAFSFFCFVFCLLCGESCCVMLEWSFKSEGWASKNCKRNLTWYYVVPIAMSWRANTFYLLVLARGYQICRLEWIWVGQNVLVNKWLKLAQKLLGLKWVKNGLGHDQPNLTHFLRVSWMLIKKNALIKNNVFSLLLDGL